MFTSGTSRKAKCEGVYASRWVGVIVRSVKFSSDCFSVLSKGESKTVSEHEDRAKSSRRLRREKKV